MQVTLHLPDELTQHFSSEELSREILEALVIQAYRAEKITTADIRSMLGFSSRWKAEEFLQKHNVELHYDLSDLNRDRATFQRLRS